MATGMSLHIGLNRISRAHYGVDGALAACEFDAKDMEKIAKALGFSTKLLLTQGAKHAAVVAAIRSAAVRLNPGDLFLLTYAGHGAQVPDLNGDETEDGMDETWVLYDRQLIDDELYALFGEFQTGVRILMLSDSCHSGSVARKALFEELGRTVPFSSPAVRRAASPAPRYRLLDNAAQRATYRAHKKLYDQVQKALPQGERTSIGASVILLSGCQDNQLSADGAKNGLFTETLKRAWDNGKFTGGLRAFHKAISREMPPWQTPNYFKIGKSSAAFERRRPFTI